MKTMTHRLMHFTAAACAALTLAGTANAITLAAWDKKINDVTNRFVVLAAFQNAAVLDKETQLVWQRSPDSTLHDWSTAFGTCLGKSTGGRMGWRLPTAEELTSLYVAFALPSGHPFANVTYDAFWTATSHPSYSAAFMMFASGGPAFHLKSTSHRAWCVRAGQGHDGT
jgi:hypothetical protein